MEKSAEVIDDKEVVNPPLRERVRKALEGKKIEESMRGKAAGSHLWTLPYNNHFVKEKQKESTVHGYNAKNKERQKLNAEGTGEEHGERGEGKAPV